VKNNREIIAVIVVLCVISIDIAARIYSGVQYGHLHEQLEDLRDHVLMMQLRVDQLDGMDV